MGGGFMDGGMGMGYGTTMVDYGPGGMGLGGFGMPVIAPGCCCSLI